MASKGSYALCTSNQLVVYRPRSLGLTRSSPKAVPPPYNLFARWGNHPLQDPLLVRPSASPDSKYWLPILPIGWWPALLAPRGGALSPHCTPSGARNVHVQGNFPLDDITSQFSFQRWARVDCWTSLCRLVGFDSTNLPNRPRNIQETVGVLYCTFDPCPSLRRMSRYSRGGELGQSLPGWHIDTDGRTTPWRHHQCVYFVHIKSKTIPWAHTSMPPAPS